MTAAASADPIRAEVEQTLRRLVDVTVDLPCAAVRRVRRAADDAATRAVEVATTPMALIRSVVELSVNALLSGRSAGRSADRSPSLGSVPSPAGTRSPAVTPRPGPAPSSDASAVSATRNGPTPEPRELPLPGYESLAASQVVDRLERLDPAELAEIREFEVAHRGRRTILGKIDQLLAGR